MPRIVRTRQARNDVLDIWEYVARNNPDAADKLVRKLDVMIQRLAEQPGIGAAQDKYRTGLRSFPVGNYGHLLRTHSDRYPGDPHIAWCARLAGIDLNQCHGVPCTHQAILAPSQVSHSGGRVHEKSMGIWLYSRRSFDLGFAHVLADEGAQ
jgi:toxin ParE1/3/4